MRSKDEVRRDVWRAMDREGVSRFPGAAGRIPNFDGAKRAAERLAVHPAWRRAKTVKVNPDSPQTHARRLALAEGKTLVMAVPRLREHRPFLLLDPQLLTDAAIREAATIKGAMRHGRAIDLEHVPRLDLVLAGSVAVDLKGARIGKGGGFSDLEYAMLIEAGRLDHRAVIATTVHPLQVLSEELLVTEHDIPLDLIATPDDVIEVERAYDRPAGILPHHLRPQQVREVPVLERMGYA